MLVATGTQIAQCPLHVLLVGEKEEDFFLIREILERNRRMLPAELEHARSLDEAHCMLQQKPYDLILFEHETGNAEAIRLLLEFHHAGRSVPFLVLT
jgi:response regulator RpfG family c-di-GMP phosphodiesterase